MSEFMSFEEFMRKTPLTPEEKLLIQTIAMLSTTDNYKNYTVEEIYDRIVEQTKMTFNIRAE